MANGDLAEPYTLTKAGDPIPGIGEASDPTSVTLGGAGNTTHSLVGHPQVAGDWDNVYMPQPKTREIREEASTSVGAGEYPQGVFTDGDDYRFWPAHRDSLGGIDGELYKSEISPLGCDRYESGPDMEAGATTSYSSDEGYWDKIWGSTRDTPEMYLGSPAYNTVYYGTPHANSLHPVSAGFPDLGDGSYSEDYIVAFRGAFAPGYFTDCCVYTVINADHPEGPTEWGSFAENGNIFYGIHYWDDDGYDGCGYINAGANCCASANTCGEIYIREFTPAGYQDEAPAFVIGGLLHGHTASSDAGRAWLHPAATYNWRESDMFALAEPTQVTPARNPPGKFGIPDNKRTSRHYSAIFCSGDPVKFEGGRHGDISQDEQEHCVMPGSWDGDWFTNEGTTYWNP